ncbi:lipid-A-disaccharide synthase [bacterium]|nr:lipid-A-disaccharide synthase [bacterium]
MRIFWVAGESSGDRHAAHLIHEINALQPDWQHRGMGGEQMEREGCELDANLSEAALMGLVEVIRHLPRLLKLRDRLVIAVDEWQADLVILVDFPDFNLALAKAIRKRRGSKTKILYYVSPQVWAWRKGRAKTIAHRVDAMAVLFPFEQEVYRPYGLETVFFGHPLAGEVEPSASVDELRKRFELKEGQEAVAILPGSRAQEIERHLPVQLQALERLRESKGEDVVGLVARANTVQKGVLSDYLQNVPNVRIVEDGAYDALAAARVGMVKSGTSTVEAALIGTPFVVLYRTSPLTFRLARMLVRGVKYIAMVNVLAGREVVRERIQDEATAGHLASDLLELWVGERRDKTIAGLKGVAESLGESGATARLAVWIVDRFGGKG